MAQVYLRPRSYGGMIERVSDAHDSYCGDECIQVSLAILGDESSTWRPYDYGYGLAGSSIRLQFPSIKLLDYLDRWPELEASTNPIAVMVMAHLKTKAAVRDASERKRWKWVLIRRLYEQGWQRQDIEQILRMLDWMMTLPPELERQFREELEAYEEERKMPLITSMERLAKEEGIQEGSERRTREQDSHWCNTSSLCTPSQTCNSSHWKKRGT